MKKAISEYIKASAVLDKKESVLNKFVEKRMIPLMANKDIDGLHELVDELPKHYKGARRIYEAMLRIEESK